MRINLTVAAVAAASTSVLMGPGAALAAPTKALPWDVNGDGYADVVIGAALEDLSTNKNTGMLHVLYGRATGVSGTGSKAYDQDTPGVPGGNEGGDQFGWTQASGDFNADGYADVAVSANAENIGAATDGGQVTIFYGSATGLRTDNVKAISIGNTLYAGTDGAFFGESLTAGDFNGDGYDELVIGAPGIGRVFILEGGDGGALFTGRSFEEQIDDGFGFDVDAADINGDGKDDLAVGSPFDYRDLGSSTGSVTLLYGTDAGLSETNRQRFSKQTGGVPGGASAWTGTGMSDSFGFQVVLGDFSGDGFADLAVAAPGDKITVGTTKIDDAGTITVLYSNGTKIATTGAAEITEATSGVPGSAGKNDKLGMTLVGGDPNGDGITDLAVYSNGDGILSVIPGATGGLATGKSKSWSQDSAGIPGVNESGDDWGASLRFIQLNAASPQTALLVGAPGENNSAGAVTLIPALAGTGLTGTGSTAFSQDTAGVPGGSEAGDFFGSFF